MKKLSFLLSTCLLFLFISCSEKSTRAVQTEVYENNSYQTLYLVRHAEKMIDGTKDPDLTDQGVRRAEKIALLLGEKNVEYIYSTDYKRTRHTAKALAEKLNLEIKLYKPSVNAAQTILDEIGDASALIVGHSNTTPALVNQFLQSEKYEKLDEREYNKMFILTKKKDKFIDSVQTY